MCDVDVDHGDTLNKKIRNAQLAQYNFILGRLIANCFCMFHSNKLMLNNFSGWRQRKKCKHGKCPHKR